MKTIYLVPLILFGLFVSACSDIRPDELLNKEESGKNDAPVFSYEDRGVIEGQYIVMFEEGAINDDAVRRASNYEQGTNIMKNIALNYLNEKNIPSTALKRVHTKAFSGMTVTLNLSEKEQVEQDPRISQIEPDRLFAFNLVPGRFTRTPLTPSVDSGMVSQTVSYGLTRMGGAKNPYPFQKVWVLDTGIDLDHPDLNVSQTLSANFCTQGTFNSNGDDGHGHGTHVAGIIGAKDNGFGALGMASGVTLVSVKVLSDEGQGSLSDAIAGLCYVAWHAQPDDVVNISWGGPGSFFLDFTLIVSKWISGAKYVVAAGNDYWGNACLNSPSRVNSSNVYTVSSIGASDSLSFFSNTGSCVDYAAPGENIYSTYKDGMYATFSGTSMAAPHISGLLLDDSMKPSGNAIGDPYNAMIIERD